MFADLGGVRLHDLRHSYASVAVSTGEELRTVAGLLGHADLITTMGYAHLATAPIAEAAKRVAKRIDGVLTPTEPIRAFHESPLRLDAFCAEHGLDPRKMALALNRHFQRRKEMARRPR